MVIRLEDFDKWGVAFKALTGKEAPRLKRNNDTQHASYKSFNAPDDYEIAIRNTKYYRHFYDATQSPGLGILPKVDLLEVLR